MSKNFKITLLFLILLEILSIFAWGLPFFNNVMFWAILALTFILSLKRIEYGLFIAFTELIISSHGYLFSFSLNNNSFVLSIRIGIFAIIILAWIIKVLHDGGFKQYLYKLKSFPLTKYYLYFAVILLWAFAWGLFRNSFANVFFDFNNWLFFLYLLPLLEVYKDKSFWNNLKPILLAALTWLIAKTFLLLYFFSHGFGFYLPEVYTWIRDTKVGEITLMDLNFYRIFIQSQIFALLSFFILLPYIISKSKIKPAFYSSIIFCLSVVIISFSRSFWVGLIAGLLIYIIYLFSKQALQKSHYQSRIKLLFSQILKLLSIAVLSVAIIILTIFLPPKTDMSNLAALFASRTTQIEAAGSSRLNMLKPLGKAIISHPVVGSGLGTTVTYRSVDPRILSNTAGANGQYTTYAFEWAYLDMILKFGIFGVFIYLLLIYQIIKHLFLNTKISTLNIGVLIALFSLLAVNIFTPYLNHPLGIGFILLSSIFAFRPADIN